MKNYTMILLAGAFLVWFVYFYSPKTKPQAPYPTPIPSGSEVTKTFGPNGPRMNIIEYAVAEGDTIASVAQRHGISVETIQLANNFQGERIEVGQVLKILPVTGVAHKVIKGDTLKSVAKKYKVEEKAILDFPGNKFADTQKHSLITGDTLIIPSGNPHP